MSGAPVKRKRISRDARRELILDAARRVILGCGLSATRVSDVAREAGVAEALVFQHFGSRDKLLDAAMFEPVEEAGRRLVATAMELPVDVSGEIQRQATARFFKELLEATTEAVSLLGMVLFSDPRAGREFYLGRIRPVLDIVVQVVRRNLETWPHRSFNPETVVQAVFGMIWGVAMDSAFTGRKPDIDRVAEELSNLVFFGLMSPEVA